MATTGTSSPQLEDCMLNEPHGDFQDSMNQSPALSEERYTSMKLRKDISPVHYDIVWRLAPGRNYLAGDISIVFRYQLAEEEVQVGAPPQREQGTAGGGGSGGGYLNTAGAGAPQYSLNFVLNALDIDYVKPPTLVALKAEETEAFYRFDPSTVETTRTYPIDCDKKIVGTGGGRSCSPDDDHTPASCGSTEEIGTGDALPSVSEVLKDDTEAHQTQDQCPCRCAELPTLADEAMEISNVVVHEDPTKERWSTGFTMTSCSGRRYAAGDVLYFRADFTCETPITSIDTVKKPEQRAGIYRCNPEVPDAVVTHLEPTHARKLYPCFDDPFFRATYQITLTYPKELSVRSSTLEECELPIPEEYPDSRTVRFKKTVPLPSYLICIAVGDFQSISQETKGGIQCSLVFSKSRPVGHGYFALDLMVQAVQFYEDFFHCALPMPKLDMMAIPELPALGMENFGLITMYADYCLVHEKTTTARRRRIARLIGHEVSHQWFGNLVSLDGWRYIWLKEGMARYMEFMFVHHVRPKWQIWADFLSQVQTASLEADANAKLLDAHAVETDPPSNPRHVFDMFDIISYGKAASIIRMIAGAMGDGLFSDALRNFFQQNAYKSVASAQLFDCWGSALHPNDTELQQEFRDHVLQWVTSVGHPYVHVERSGPGLRVSQFFMRNTEKGFLDNIRPSSGLSPRLNSATPNTPRLSVPGEGKKPVSAPMSALDFQTSCFWLPMKVTQIEQGQTTATKHISINKQSDNFTAFRLAWFHTAGFGAFRCDYDVQSWEGIFEVYPFFGVLDRLTICMSIFELRSFHVGIYPADGVDRCLLLPKLLQALQEKKENHTYIWSYVAPELVKIVSLVRQGSVWAVFRPFLNRVTHHLVDNRSASFRSAPSDESNSGNPSELCSQTLLPVLRLLCAIQNPAILDEAKDYFQWVMSALTSAYTVPESYVEPPELSSVDIDRACIAFEAVGQNGSFEDWSAMFWAHRHYCLSKESRSRGSGDVALEEDEILVPEETVPAFQSTSTVVFPSSLTLALLGGIFSRDSGEVVVLNRQLAVAGCYNCLGSSCSALIGNTKLFSAVLDAESSKNPVLPSKSLQDLLNAAPRMCSSPIIAQQVNSLCNSQRDVPSPLSPPSPVPVSPTKRTAWKSSTKVLALETVACIERSCRWVEYITDFYFQYLHRFHARTASGVSMDSRDSSQSLGT